jgi:hypothetical protein
MGSSAVDHDFTKALPKIEVWTVSELTLLRLTLVSSMHTSTAASVVSVCRKYGNARKIATQPSW